MFADHEVLAPHMGMKHTNTTADKDIKMMTASILEYQVTCPTPKRKLPSGKRFTTPERKGYDIALSKQWISKFLRKQELRIEDDQNTEDHEEIGSVEDIPL